MFRNTRHPVKKIGDTTYIQIGKNTGSIPLVMLHGMFGGLSNYDLLLDHYNGAPFLTIVPELPTFRADTMQITIGYFADWLHNFVTEIGISRMNLLGNSMGGQIALKYVLAFPENVEKLILTGSSGLMESKIIQKAPRRFDRDFIRKQASRTFYDKRVDEEMVDEIVGVLKSPEKLRNIIKLAREIRDTDMAHLLPEINKPALLIWGENDKITTPEVARQFEKLLPDATLSWISGCGHAPMMEHAEAFADVLKEFLEIENNIYI